MKTKRAIFIVGLIFHQAALAQIGSKVKEQTSQGLPGTWVNTEFGYTMTLLLLSNGSGEFDGESITYTAGDNSLAIKFATEVVTYQYNLAGDQLTLSGGDLDSAITFGKSGAERQATANALPTQTADSPTRSIVGKWESQGQVLDFMANGKVVIDGNSFDYQTQGTTVILSTPQGAVQFQYQLGGNTLTLTGPGGSLVYNKFNGSVPPAGPTGVSSNSGSAPAELAGKWCYVNVASTGSGGWSTDECIILNANGTYEYYSENSGSATVTNQYGTQIATGGTSSQTSDAGTWSLQGSVLVASSRSGGNQSFTFEKRNHPKNGDPMIVLNGRTYVTFYQKPPWR
ncbi:hypothetical protein [uncultured Imperialibacter sp.]|uniref:hypothetical protein n=1 Tax=uncultured Imperialibacter sp. TaxID=1672639 RepID=UPI0030D6F0E6|tara:strand:+ start:36036 stop:37061 length:1026 start_codon:yes stop_codon:yes gene_type:complete